MTLNFLKIYHQKSLSQYQRARFLDPFIIIAGTGIIIQILILYSSIMEIKLSKRENRYFLIMGEEAIHI